MFSFLTAYLLLLFLGAAMLPMLGLYVWRRRKAGGMTAGAVYFWSAAVWGGCYLLYLLSPDPAVRLFWFKAQHVGSVMLTPAVLFFALGVMGRGQRLKPWLAALMALEVLITLAMVFTNDAHHLFWTTLAPDPNGGFPPLIADRGPYGRLRMFYANTLQAGAVGGLVLWLPRTSPAYRRELLLAVTTSVFPWLAALLTYTGLSPFGRLDLSTGGHALMALSWVALIVRRGLLDIVPVARHAVIEGMRDAMFTVNSENIVMDMNPAAQFLLGSNSSGALGRPAAEVFARWPALLHRLQESATESSYVEVKIDQGAPPKAHIFEFRIAAWRDQQNRLLGRLVVAYDITERKLAEAELERQALYDALTGLPNRVLLSRRLEEALGQGEGQGAATALLIMDLNGFKDVNDTFGHETGDELLRQVAGRLQRVVRQGETAARLGGDEFAVILPGAAGGEIAILVAQRILAAFEAPFTAEVGALAIGVSIGIALAPEHGSDAPALMRQADIAMYAAKRFGGGYAVFNPAADSRNPVQLALLAELRQAIAAGELTLHYQPQITIATRRLRGVEALVRWRHPGLGLLPPDSFIPLAERSGLIQPLTAWVLDAALRQAGAWRSAGRPIPVAINLSIANLWNPLLAAEIQRLARRWQVPLSDVTLELTENFVMADPDQARAVLSGLRNLGVRVALDDFGMGQSSLTWLHQLPVDEIKIDKSFVMDMADDEYGTALVRLAAETGHQLGLQVVAEGVDRLETLDLLLSLGCDAAQGHAICPPVPAAELEDWANARV